MSFAEETPCRSISRTENLFGETRFLQEPSPVDTQASVQQSQLDALEGQLRGKRKRVKSAHSSSSAVAVPACEEPASAEKRARVQSTSTLHPPPLPDAIVYCDRVIFRHNGALYYVSTGANSEQKGLVFPFYGIRLDGVADGWMIKRPGSGIAYTIFHIMQTPDFVEHPFNGYDPDDFDALIAKYKFTIRFETLEDINLSYRFCRDIWMADPFLMELATKLAATFPMNSSTAHANKTFRWRSDPLVVPQPQTLREYRVPEDTEFLRKWLGKNLGDQTLVNKTGAD
jgi:hypothetical protein